MTLYQRFNIEIGLEEAQSRFVNRVYNNIFNIYLDYYKKNHDALYKWILLNVANKLGDKFAEGGIGYYVKNDSIKCLLALEAIYNALGEIETLTNGGDTPENAREVFSRILQNTISESEVDIGISWTDGIFTRTGAKYLDEGLVNEPLQWLSDPKYQNVLKPFQKGLQHYMESTKRPELLEDTVIAMYEALEALAKIVTRRPGKDLSANRELFVKKLGLNDYYKKMLDAYIAYACEYRHAVEEGKDRPIPSSKEVEAFVYTTGLFIRLAVAE